MVHNEIYVRMGLVRVWTFKHSEVYCTHTHHRLHYGWHITNERQEVTHYTDEEKGTEGAMVVGIGIKKWGERTQVSLFWLPWCKMVHTKAALYSDQNKDVDGYSSIYSLKNLHPSLGYISAENYHLEDESQHWQRVLHSSHTAISGCYKCTV